MNLQIKVLPLFHTQLKLSVTVFDFPIMHPLSICSRTSKKLLHEKATKQEISSISGVSCISSIHAGLRG